MARPALTQPIGRAMRRENPANAMPRSGCWRCVARPERGDSRLSLTHELLKRPYDEQPERAGRFYRRAPRGSDQQGGVGFMS